MGDAKNYLGIEGYGAEAVGGVGGRIIHVTTLEDSGPGSLREALEADGPRIIVFDVAGQIDLKSQILVENPNVTIAGQTAPGDGITISDDRIRIKTSEVVIQGLHFRPGDDPEGHNPGDRDGLMIGTTDFELKNIVVDHNSFTWATDENVSINGSVKNLTFSNNLVAEGLSNSINPSGEHSKGLLISNWDQLTGDANGYITVIKNLFAHNNDRNPEVRAGQEIEIINNYIYDSGRAERSIAIGGGSLGSLLTSVDVIGNVIDYGLSTTKINRGPISITTMADGSTVYLSDNLLIDRATDLDGNQSQTGLVYDTGGGKYVTFVNTTSSGANILDASDVRAYVLANVGANPFDRDQTDSRIVNSVITGTGTLINSTAQVATGPAFIPTLARDTDGDAIPDWYENLYGTDQTTFSAYGDFDDDGYYDIEEYLYELIGGPANIVAKSVGAIIGSDDTRELYRLTAGANTLMLLPQFSIADGDRIEIGGFTGDMKDAVKQNYVDIAYAWGNTFLSVDRDGAGSQYQLELVAEFKGRVTAAELMGALTLVGQSEVSTPLNILVGTNSSEQLVGLSEADAITGLAGDDLLFGRGGDDTLVGDEGNDRLDGGMGADAMNGGTGDDRYVVDSASDTVAETLDGGTDKVFASVNYSLSANVESLTLTGASSLKGIGNNLSNRLKGNDGDNILRAFGERDKVWGGDGNDTLRGGRNSDTLRGGDGDDTLIGGRGHDRLYGGQGSDSFVLALPNSQSHRDIIFDFVSGIDKIDISKFADSAIPVISGTDAVSDGQQLVWDATSSTLYYDADGAGEGAMVAVTRIVGITELNASDFTF